RLFRTIIDSIPDYICIKDTASRFILNNQAHLKSLGVKSQAEAVGRTVLDFFPPRLAHQFLADDREVLTSGLPITEKEELVTDREGNQRWHLTSKVPLKNPQGDIIGLLCLSRDITHQKQADDLLRKAHDELELRVLNRTQELARANESLQSEIAERRHIENALRASEQRYRRLLSSVTDYIYTVYIEEGRVARTNHSPNCVAVTGYTPEEYTFNPNLWYEMIHPEDRPLVLQHLTRLLTDENAPPLEHRIIHKDGSIRWVRNTTVLRRSQDGRVISYDGLITDITARKTVEEALRESESHYRQLMEYASDGIVILRPNGEIINVNSKATELVGYSHRELIGRNWRDLIPPPELKTNPPAYQDLIAGKTVLKERNLLTKTGDTRAVEISARLIDPDHILAIIRDITERKAMERRENLAHQVGLQLTTVLDRNALLAQTVNRLKDTFGYYHAHVYMVSDEKTPGGDLLLVVQEGTGAAGVALKAKKHAIPINAVRSLVARAARTRQPVVVNDVTQSADHLPNPLLPATRSEAALPLFLGDTLLGVLDVQHTRVDHFTPSEVRTLQIIASQLSVALANVRLFEDQQRLLAEVRASQQRLQALSHRLVQVQEAERRHIARELHDEVGQLLTGLKLTLEMSTRLPDSEIRASLSEPQALVNELISQVRELALELRPAMLDDLGLLPALQWQFERYTSQTGIQVDLHHQGIENERFPAAVETAAFRIVQEALTNVARYAQVGQVSVDIQAGPDTLQVTVTDHGVGFDLAAAQSEGPSSGLSGMEERAVLLGGTLTIDAQPGRGVRICACLPRRLPDTPNLP
ncbi:MAG: PAS domain S-box protein, partial [Chloroflexi bacterium]